MNDYDLYTSLNSNSGINGINPSKLSWNTAQPVADSFSRNLGSNYRSIWSPAQSTYMSAETTPLNYNLADAINTGQVNLANIGTDGSWLDGLYGGLKNTFLNSDGSWNLQNIGAGIQGLGSLASAFGSLYMGNKALKFAKDQFNFQKDLANTNLNNSIKSYNTKLGDIANTRSVMETGSTGKYDNWYNDNKLSR